MQRLVEASITDPTVLALAQEITVMCAWNDKRCYIPTVKRWTRKHFHYYPDPAVAGARGLAVFGGAKELVRPPILMAKQFRATGVFKGDCDDLAMMQAALLGALATPARFVVIATPKHGGQYDHVLTEGYDGGRWLAMDFLTSYPAPASTVSAPLAWPI